MAVLTVKERQELLAQSTYGSGRNGIASIRCTGFSRVTVGNEGLGQKAGGSVSLKQFRSELRLNNEPINPHRKEILRMERNPVLIDKDREHYEQTLFFAEVFDNYPQYYNLTAATPNGGFRKKAERWRLCAEGQKAGWPDTQFMMPRHGYNGLFIEFKKPFECYRCISDARRATKPHQINTLRMLVAQDYAGFVAFGAKEGMRIFEAYLQGRSTLEGLKLFFPNETLNNPFDGELCTIDSFATLEAQTD